MNEALIGFAGVVFGLLLGAIADRYDILYSCRRCGLRGGKAQDDPPKWTEYQKEHIARIIESCDKLKEITPLEDGFLYFWVKDRGAMSAWDLRIIADELDKRNEPWWEEISRLASE